MSVNLRAKGLAIGALCPRRAILSSFCCNTCHGGFGGRQAAGPTVVVQRLVRQL